MNELYQQLRRAKTRGEMERAILEIHRRIDTDPMLQQMPAWYEYGLKDESELLALLEAMGVYESQTGNHRIGMQIPV